jgi:hypothetical protein
MRDKMGRRKANLPLMAVLASFLTYFPAGSVHADSVVDIAQCGALNQANTTYVLQSNVRSEGTCFTVNASNVILDLNGYTVTYDDYPNSGLPNPDFELGSGNIPANWDLSMAPTATRQSTSEHAMINEWYFFLGNAPDNTRVVSPWTYLPENAPAAVYFLRGERLWAYSQAPLWNMEVSFEDGTIVFSENFTDKQVFEFNTRGIDGRYRAVLTLVEGYGLAFDQYGGYPSFDLFDIRTVRNYGVSAQYKTNVQVKNGRIVQGRGESYWGHAIYLYSTTDSIVENVNIESKGLESASIYAMYGMNTVIRNCLVVNGNPGKLNRHQIGAAFFVGTSNSLIKDNTMDCGEGWGCIYAGGDNTEVSNNTLAIKCRVTNHHAITTYGTENVKIHHNTITTDPGQGILFSMSSNGSIYENTIKVLSTAPNYEYGYFQVDAITIKDYHNNGVCHDLDVYKNNITIHGKKNDYYTGYPDPKPITGIMSVCSGNNVLINDNLIVAKTIDSNVLVAGINPDDQFGHMVRIYNNTIDSEKANVLIGGYAQSGGNSLYNIKFGSNIFVKGPNAASDYHTIWLSRGGNITSDMLEFVNTKQENGASLEDIRLAEYGNYMYSTKWSGEVYIYDNNGNPAPNVDVVVKDKSGFIVFDGDTDGDGAIRNLQFKEYEVSGNGSAMTADYEYFTPHSVTITEPGGAVAVEEFYTDFCKKITYQFSGTVDVSDLDCISETYTPPLTPPTRLRIVR